MENAHGSRVDRLGVKGRFPSDGLFSLGLAGPIALLYFGFVAIGLVCSGAAIVVRREANSELTSGNSQTLIDSAIASLVISVLYRSLGEPSTSKEPLEWERYVLLSECSSCGPSAD